MIKKTFFFCVLTFFFFCSYSQSQIYPVQVNANLIPPYRLYLSDYVSGSRDHLNLILLNKDIDYQSMPVRLRLTIKGNGFSIQTRPYIAAPQITLEPNVPYKLTPEELRPYFDLRNLSAQGMGSSSFLKSGRLPEGMLEFGIEVIEYTTGKVISRNGMAPKSAFAYSLEIFREIITSTSYLYGMMSAHLEAGGRYAWAVRVVGKDGAKWTYVLYV